MVSHRVERPERPQRCPQQRSARPTPQYHPQLGAGSDATTPPLPRRRQRRSPPYLRRRQPSLALPARSPRCSCAATKPGPVLLDGPTTVHITLQIDPGSAAAGPPCWALRAPLRAAASAGRGSRLKGRHHIGGDLARPLPSASRRRPRPSAAGRSRRGLAGLPSQARGSAPASSSSCTTSAWP